MLLRTVRQRVKSQVFGEDSNSEIQKTPVIKIWLTVTKTKIIRTKFQISGTIAAIFFNLNKAFDFHGNAAIIWAFNITIADVRIGKGYGSG